MAIKISDITAILIVECQLLRGWGLRPDSGSPKQDGATEPLNVTRPAAVKYSHIVLNKGAPTKQRKMEQYRRGQGVASQLRVPQVSAEYGDHKREEEVQDPRC